MHGTINIKYIKYVVIAFISLIHTIYRHT